MRRLLTAGPAVGATADPTGSRTGGDEVSDGDLLADYAYPAEARSRPWVRANMVGTLDGAATGPDGLSGSIATEADRRLFALLRSLCDVILVGAGTARAERYAAVSTTARFADLRDARGQAPAPVVAVVSRSLDLDPASPLFVGAASRTIVLTAAAAPEQRRRELAEVADVAVLGDTEVDARAAIALLGSRGLRRVQCEGGPALLRAIVTAGLLDELCLTVAPVLRGGGTRTVLGPPPLERPWPATLAAAYEEDGALFTRWTARTGGTAPRR